MASDGTVLYAYLDVSYYARRGECQRAAAALRRARRLHVESDNRTDDILAAASTAAHAIANRCGLRRR